jgi:hypothetical protein
LRDRRLLRLSLWRTGSGRPWRRWREECFRALVAERFFKIGAQRQKLLKRVAHGVFRVVLVKWLPPVFAPGAELGGCFRRGKSCAPSIH